MSRVFFRLLAFMLCAALGICRADTRTVTVTNLAGDRIAGEFSDWSAVGITLDTDHGSEQIAAADLLNLQFASEPGQLSHTASILTLTDGTRLAIDSFEMHNHTATIESHWASEPLQLPSEVVQLVQFPTAQQLDWLAEWEKADFTEDVLIVHKKGSGKCDFLPGVIQEVTPTQVQFTWEGDTLPVKRSKLAALSLFHSPTSAASEPLCRLQLATGETLVAQSQKLLESDRLLVTTVSGLRLEIPLGEIARADYSFGKLEYLSDCQPLLQKWTPLVALPGEADLLQAYGAPRRDMSREGTPLTIAWPATADAKAQLKTFAKGLAVRSRTELEYRVPRSMNRFLATAGIDPETASQGNVVLRIELDGTVAFDETIDGHQQPVDIDLEVTGRQQLKITVDYGENLDLGDYLHLVEARWSK
jgi:hypothetical protein